MKRPAFQFYPADWRKDAALQSCSMAAQGLWINLLCIANECEPYGHLVINGKAIGAAQISRLVGLAEKDCARLLVELRDAGVSSIREDDGAIYSRRMVRDERVRELRAEGGNAGAEFGHLGKEYGRLGGRPRRDRGDTKPPIEPAPSSSSSSSKAMESAKPDGEALAKRSPAPRGSRLASDWTPSDEQIAYCRAERPELHPGQVAMNFRDYWTAKAGASATKVDWNATWRTWVRREQGVSHGRNGIAPNGKFSVAGYAERVRDDAIARELDGGTAAPIPHELRLTSERGDGK